MRPLFFALALLAVPGCGHAAAPSRSAPPRAAEEMRTLLTELIAVDTSNPPGNETAAAQVAARWLSEAGIESQLFEPVPGRAHLMARLKGTGGARPV
ncbi:MAG TPA: peptidase M20, partial [Cystobacter sp.]